MTILLNISTLHSHSKQSKVGSPTATNPFLASPPPSSGNIVDLFGPADGAAAQPAQQSNALDDLLQLGNPFADMFGAPAPQQQQQQPVPNQWMTNGKNSLFVVFSVPFFLHLKKFEAICGKKIILYLI